MSWNNNCEKLKKTRSYTYRGMIIYENISDFNTVYFTVVNPFKINSKGKSPHAHFIIESSAKKSVDCLHKIRRGGYPGKVSNSVRNKALRLASGKVVHTKS